MSAPVLQLVVVLLFLAAPVSAQIGFPDRGLAIVQQLYAGVNPQDDAARRARIVPTCEQLVFDLGGRWGGKKRAGLGDEHRSPDSIAFLEDNGSVSVWDIQLSSGAIDLFPGKPPNYPQLPAGEAAFMPCAPVNHLGVAPPPPPPPVLADDEALERAILAEVQALREQVAENEARAEAFRQSVKGKWSRFGRGALKVGVKLWPVIAGAIAGIVGS